MMMAIIAMIVVILVGIVLNSIHLTFHLTSLCWFTGECLWVPKRRIKWIYVFCPTGRSVECFPNSRWKESHLSSNCRGPMIKNKLSAEVIIKKGDVDMIHVCKSKHLDNILFWLIWPQKKCFFSSWLALGNVSFDDPKGVQTALTLSISLAESTYWQLRFKSKFHSSRLIQTKQYLSSTCTVHIVDTHQSTEVA